LPGEGKEHIVVALGKLHKLGVADLPHFALGLGPDPGAAVLVAKEPHLAKKISRVEIGDDHFPPVFVLDKHSHRALDDIVEGVAGVASVNQGAFGGVATAVAVAEKVPDIGDMWRYR